MTKSLRKTIRPRKVQAIFVKELRELLNNREIMLGIVIMPIVFALLVPASMIALNYTDQGEPLEGEEAFFVFRNIARNWESYSPLQQLTIIQANFYLAFLIMIPLIIPMAISADSFAGEKERKTIESLLAAPVNASEIFLGKTLAATVPTVIISWLAEIVYIIFVDIITYNVMGGKLILPNVFSIIMLLLIVPTQTMLSTIIMSGVSSKAKGSREAMQKTGLLAIPIIILGNLVIFIPIMIHPLLSLASEALLVLITILFLRRVAKRMDRERLLSVGS